MSSETYSREAAKQFTGTENWYRHWARRDFLYTDGVKWVADSAGAYWLIDLIASLQHAPRVRAEKFQVWKLKVGAWADGFGSALLVCEDGNDVVVHTHQVEFTAFPQDGVDFWYANGVLHLPSEY